MDKRLEFTFDENLREVPKDSLLLQQYVNELEQSLSSIEDSKKRVSVLGELGVRHRSLGQLDKAESYLLEALKIINDENLGVRWETQQLIRLAHVFQWQKRFAESDEMFAKVIATCRSNSEARVYLDFALQHAGKNFFDQQRYAEALELFEETMTLRQKRQAPEDQIESTQRAINRTKELLKR